MFYLPLVAQQTADIHLRFSLNGFVALLAGILILFLPRLLNYIVAVYLIVIGLVEVLNIRL